MTRESSPSRPQRGTRRGVQRVAVLLAALVSLGGLVVAGAGGPPPFSGRPAVAATPAVVTVVLEEPGPNEVVSGVRNLRGFTFSAAAHIVSVEISIDGVAIPGAPCCSARGDVKAAFPSAPLDTGFSTIWNWGLITDGAHEITVKVTDGSNNVGTASQTFEVRNLQSASLGAFLDDADLGAATCATEVTQSGDRICCDDVEVKSTAGHQTCDDVCWVWNRASQGMAFRSANCAPPILVTPTPTPKPSVTPTPTKTATNGQLCGNGIVEGDEECDGDDLADEDCESLIGGFANVGNACSGSLGCTASCTFNVSACRCSCEEDADCSYPQIDCTSANGGSECLLDGACFQGLCFVATSNASKVSQVCNGKDLDAEDSRVVDLCGP